MMKTWMFRENNYLYCITYHFIIYETKNIYPVAFSEKNICTVYIIGDSIKIQQYTKSAQAVSTPYRVVSS